MSDCTFTHIETHSQQLDACPLCGHPGELWELVDEHGVFKFACCGRSADGSLGLADGCPLCNPPRHFYMPTLREAARRWNDFAAAAIAARASYTPGRAPQHVLKAEAATPDATDRGEPDSSSPSVGSMGAGQPADAGPAGGEWKPVSLLRRPGEGKARIALRRTAVRADGVPVSEYLPDTFATLEEAYTASLKLNGGAA